MGEGNENLVYSSLRDLKSCFTCRKILRHGTSGFTSHTKGRFAADFMDLKNPSNFPGSNPRPLGSVARTVTTTKPRQRLKTEKNVIH
jgi:hypothetical protein